MKKLYILTVLTLMTSLSWGQYEIHILGNNTDISGGEYIADNVFPDSLLVKKFYFKNLSGSSQTVSVCRYKVFSPNGWSDGLCWAPFPSDPLFEGGCYGAGQMQGNPWCSPTVTVPDGTESEIISDITVATNPGEGLYRYYFKIGGSYVDSFDIHINAILGINDPEPLQVGMTAFPNPASTMITINTVGLSGEYSVRITDVLGKVVYADEAGAIKKIDVSNFKNGVYLINVSEKGEAIQTRRVVVKH